MIEWTSKARKQITKISKSDKKNALIILNKVELLDSNPNGEKLDIEKLKKDSSHYRLKVKDYRVIYQIIDKVFIVEEVVRRTSVTYS